jgi:hypothetical protein
MRRNPVGILAVAATLTLGACGEDSTGPGTDDLTEDEAAQVAAFLMGQAVGATGVTPAAQAAADPQVTRLPLALARVDFDEDVSVSAQCPLGGSIQMQQTVTGFTDDETGAFELNVAQTQVYDSCAGEGESGAFAFTLDSAPDVMAAFSIAQDAAGLATASGAMVGALDWTAGDRSGRCEIDFQFSLDGDGENADFNASGTICGVALSRTLSISS